MKKLLPVLAALSLTTTAFAGVQAPEKCPGVAAIVAQGLSQQFVDRDNDNKWMFYTDFHQLDTKEPWAFAIGNISADTAADAFKSASESLATLKLMDGPTEFSQVGMWVCTYSTDNSYYGAAFARIDSQQQPSDQIAKQLRQVKIIR